MRFCRVYTQLFYSTSTGVTSRGVYVLLLRWLLTGLDSHKRRPLTADLEFNSKSHGFTFDNLLEAALMSLLECLTVSLFSLSKPTSTFLQLFHSFARGKLMDGLTWLG